VIVNLLFLLIFFHYRQFQQSKKHLNKKINYFIIN